MPGNKEKVGFIFEMPKRDALGGTLPGMQPFFGSDLTPESKWFLASSISEARSCDRMRRGGGPDFSLPKNAARVVITWDLEPAWGGIACRHDDRISRSSP